MQVFELMNILKDLPAGMEVRAMEHGGSKVGAISHHESDGIDSEGVLSLIFSADPDYELEEKTS